MLLVIELTKVQRDCRCEAKGSKQCEAVFSFVIYNGKAFLLGCNLNATITVQSKFLFFGSLPWDHCLPLTEWHSSDAGTKLQSEEACVHCM